MGFKSLLFFSSSSSSKKSDSDASSSPRSVGSASPIRYDKKNPNSNSKSELQTPPTTSLKKKGQPLQTASPTPRKTSFLRSNAKKTAETDARNSSSSFSPIMASSLGLNRIKTRSGPLPQESFLSFSGENPEAAVGGISLSRQGDRELEACSTWGDSVSGVGSSKTSNVSNSYSSAGDLTPNLPPSSKLLNRESSSEARKVESSWDALRNSDDRTPENSFSCKNPKDSETPRYQTSVRVSSAPTKRFLTDIKSFSHELNSKGVRPYPFWKPRGRNNVEEVVVLIRAKFDKAKEEVNSDLAIFAADLVGVLERDSESHPEWQEIIEDLLVLSRTCAITSPEDFWLQCEGIVQDLDDRRQELAPGMLKQLCTRMLFILTRCTRLLQFHKESGWAEDEEFFQLRQSRILHSADRRIPHGIGKEVRNPGAPKASKVPSAKKAYSQEQRGLDWMKNHAVQTELSPPVSDASKDSECSSSMDEMSSWKKLLYPPEKKEVAPTEKQTDLKVGPSKTVKRRGVSDAEVVASKLHEHKHDSKHRQKISWGYWGDQQILSEESSIICRICEEELPTAHVEDHSRICAVADRCDQKGLSVNERLYRIAEMLDKMIESFEQKGGQHIETPDFIKVTNACVTEEYDGLSPKLSDWSRCGSEDKLDYCPEGDNIYSMDDLKAFSAMTCKTRFGPKSDQGMTTSSAGSMTPRSPILTPRTCQIDLLLAGKGSYSEHGDIPQLHELADIAKCVANAPLDNDLSLEFLLSCLEDLRAVIERRKFDARAVETFGARIEKLIREKCLEVCELVGIGKADIAKTVIDEDAPLEDDATRGLRKSPVRSLKDRTSIEDFEIIKPISRGAFGRVFLAKKRTTGDLFAIKVLKKADMIRKNAVESILAERDILISVRNPFVVRFFYSFTSRENLYLVMEYLNGGDLYSLLRNLGCLEEDVARMYIAEVVLALEYLHSLGVVHRDLKPDNLLIAHDGHIKLTDFGLSKVGLINSTDDLSGPEVPRTPLLEDEEPRLSASEHQQESRAKRSAVGTPDYLAPEILLGTGHGATADWWSVGVILFELIVGIPPFNADHPKDIFDNILNREIPWPQVPEEMSFEARDLIDKLLTEDPHLRLGATGASEVKRHGFFKNINWETLARQKAAFVPASESALDTSYFTSRMSWNSLDNHVNSASDYDSSDAESSSGSISGLSSRQDEVGDECKGLAELDPDTPVQYSFSNFSYKNASELGLINYDLLSKGLKDDSPSNSNR